MSNYPDIKVDIIIDYGLTDIAARGIDGVIVEYPAFENRHRDHILDLTTAPAAISPDIAKRAVEVTRAILRQLQYVGVLCVEFFVSTDNELLVN